ncbi:hypothetical protein SCUCBS95973_002711 [Sporothrix curviconia]|uniref:Uncharacterized protein n=1 Tax=Sporothrix curviconia TaxID=1260050 RepID=A0ABP0B9B8_9PEZI
MEDEAMDVVEGHAAAPPSTAQAAAAIVDSIVNAPLNGTGSTFAAWNTPKHREEVDSYRTRLVDQGFNPSDFGDPLTTERPVAKVYSRAFPEGTEASLRKLIKKKE